MSMRSSTTSPHSRRITCSRTYVDEIVSYEKGIVLEMITSPAWQAAGRAGCVAHSAHLRRLCSPQRYVRNVVLTFYNKLKGMPENHPVLPTDPKTYREHMMPTRFGTLSMPAMCDPDCPLRFEKHDGQCDGHWRRRFTQCAHLRKSCSASRHPPLGWPWSC